MGIVLMTMIFTVFIRAIRPIRGIRVRFRGLLEFSRVRFTVPFGFIRGYLLKSSNRLPSSSFLEAVRAQRVTASYPDERSDIGASL